MLHLTRIEGKPTPFEMCSHFQIGTLRCIDISSESCHKSLPIFYDFSSKCIEWILQYHVLLAHANIQITIPHVCNFGMKKVMNFWHFKFNSLVAQCKIIPHFFECEMTVCTDRISNNGKNMTTFIECKKSPADMTWNYYLHSKIFAANLECNRCTFILQCAFVL